MKILLSSALIVALLSAAFPSLAAKQPSKQPLQTEKPQQPQQPTPLYRGVSRR
ncbi:MAG: hypothetical protein KME32_33930 [Mojavia pulchra JT2-VF2]|uniref:Uncharacterized protein n=1 Tax=Mojavia pulchra JT2-VF2 TaxID=287848 RepID=A0A951Q7C5_9NOST|nr:hypothetical protein [Mojavia pulchra JT2-VF2]